MLPELYREVSWSPLAHLINSLCWIFIVRRYKSNALTQTGPDSMLLPQ